MSLVSSLCPTCYQSIDLLIACDISGVAEHKMDWTEMLTKDEDELRQSHI